MRNFVNVCYKKVINWDKNKITSHGSMCVIKW